MLTIFTIPKPFKGHIEVIQRNAIQSWRKLQPNCEIILFGNDFGISEAAEEFDLIHVPNINKTEYGTPLLDFVFQRAQKLASNDLLCYANSDIIFLSDFLPALKEINFKKFLLAGQRWDLDLQIPWDFQSNDWEGKLQSLMLQNGSLHDPAGIDYFVFTKGMVQKMPPFAVGREGWDNWFIYNARSMRVPVIDATQRITAVHQNHDYNHVPKKSGSSWQGPESDRNLTLLGRRIYQWSLEDANWRLDLNSLIKRHAGFRELFRRLTLVIPPAFHPILENFFILQHNLRYGEKLRKL
jgi:hypothetical protein